MIWVEVLSGRVGGNTGDHIIYNENQSHLVHVFQFIDHLGIIIIIPLGQVNPLLHLL